MTVPQPKKISKRKKLTDNESKSLEKILTKDASKKFKKRLFKLLKIFLQANVKPRVK